MPLGINAPTGRSTTSLGLKTASLYPKLRPAPGFRDHSSGALNNVGNYGFSWSSSFSGTGGMFLNFDAQSLTSSYVGHRAHGLQLRCLSE